MVVVGKWQVLDAVIHGIAQIVAHVRADPLDQVALSQVQNRCASAKADEDQRRANEKGGRTGFQAPVDDTLDDLWHNQSQAGHAQEQQDVEGNLPEVGPKEGAEF